MKNFWSKRIRDMVPYVPGEPRLYPDPECAELRDAIAEYHGLPSDMVFAGNGSDEILAFCFQAFFDPDRTILFPDITYSFYPVYAAYFGLTFREVPLDGDFGMPVAELCCGGSGGVVVANPNAPTGRAIELHALRAILESNPDCVVLVDEAYVDFGAQSAAGLVPEYDNLVVVHTLSKSRSLAGGAALCPGLHQLVYRGPAGPGGGSRRDAGPGLLCGDGGQGTGHPGADGGPPAGAGLYGVPLRRQLHFYLPPRPGRPGTFGRPAGKGRIGPLV